MIVVQIGNPGIIHTEISSSATYISISYNSAARYSILDAGYGQNISHMIYRTLVRAYNKISKLAQAAHSERPSPISNPPPDGQPSMGLRGSRKRLEKLFSFW
jgi:hypothetical protein